MDALLMCGGQATRLDSAVEKPLFEIAGRPMIDRVLNALAASRIDRVLPVVSPHAPDTREHLAPASEVIETPGEGYVADLGAALADELVTRPVLTVVADLPLLTPGLVDDTLGTFGGRDLTCCVPVGLKRALAVSVDTTRTNDGMDLAPTGLNVVAADDGVGPADNDSVARQDNVPATVVRTDAGEDLLVSYDARLAVNVNRLGDAAVAEVLADGP